MGPRPSDPAERTDNAARPVAEQPIAEILTDSDDMEPTDATTDEVVAWLDGHAPCPWPR